ncbi:hypothetical protein FJZ19_05190 [Candidatus Pacearchaeota archaeon]|nr:hypothetical protein [Candidatus Pacearchaeota archaeon]
MPTYHLIDSGYTGETGKPRIVEIETEHKLGQFKRAQCHSKSINRQYPTLLVKDAGGSLILADVESSRLGKLSKIHIGKLLIRNPHMEVYREGGAEGPRVDLHEVDLRFARERLAELLMWRDPKHRKALMARYSNPPVCSWYSTQHRVRQLKISPAGLEIKIEEMQRLVDVFGRKQNPTFVSDTTCALEEMAAKLVRVINDRVGEAEVELRLHPKSRAEMAKPKYLEVSGLLSHAEQMYSLLADVLNYVAQNARVEEASEYWQRIDAWENM